MRYEAGEYDVVVVGAGHAGCEAALAPARIGFKTLLLTMNLDSIAMMACNPSIGGTGKGHLVREVDALGGEIGKNIDKTTIQSRMLNTAKGPAVHSLRAQADKKEYHKEMKYTIENEEKLDLKQHEVVDIIIEDNKVKGILTKTGAIYYCKAIIIATGTYLKSKIIIGDTNYNGGPSGLFASNELSDSLGRYNIDLMRFKTGTPARVDRNTLDFNKMDIQEGDEQITPFSFETEEIKIKQHPCYLTYTNQSTHDVILKNLNRSPLYSGDIEGVGPRYCPSIEDKVVRFSDKPSHQIFIEPEGLDTNEVYVQGMSSSLPEDVQIALLRTVKGFENVEIMRSAYAIEYDNINPLQLKPSLELKHINGLFFAGQINGTSGYEEAAAQGIIAGINSVQYISGKEPLILDRSEAYIGVLIDDIVTKGTNEPYRMMTSRAEYRLLLRQDNADLRLTEKGYEIGLIKESRYKTFFDKKRQIIEELNRLKTVIVIPNEENNNYLQKMNSTKIISGISLYELIKRPEIKYEKCKIFDVDRPDLNKTIKNQVEIQIKYEGYINRQKKQVQQFKKMEKKVLPTDIDYSQIKGLRLEAQQKLNEIKPISIGQASRIGGVSPADISVLLVYMEQQRRKSKR